MAATPDSQLATMVANLAANTGRSIDAWAALVRDSGTVKHGEMVAWLKAEHGLTHGYANLIAHHARSGAATGGGVAGTSAAAGGGARKTAAGAAKGKAPAGRPVAAAADGAIEAMLDGKESLASIVAALMAAIRALGDDVEEAPKKGYLSLRRTTQFATVHPSTKTRVDLGLKLKGIAPSGRLEAAGSWNAMVTHRVRLEDADAVDATVTGWLRQAYDGAA